MASAARNESGAALDRATGRVDRTQIVAVVLWIAFGVAILAFSEPLAMFNRRGGPGPGFFLKWLAGLLLALAVLRGVTLLRDAWSRRAASFADASSAGGPVLAAEPIRAVNVLKVVAMGGVLVAYAYFMPVLGFLLATTALCWATLTLLGRHPLRAALEAGVAAFAVRYAFTQGLGVPLPEAQLAFLRGLGL